ncbi:trigger factor [Adlercreutzia sp. ZJ242]|uniref:trigger factor n=1 Tax=Adlercreutzia sp. ZJ242 TaxID=2709409 RepID=UPI0013EB03C8|nr:trigger factor [Adlercreutzia sp. ZJ242]
MKPEHMSLADAGDGKVRVEASFAAADVSSVFEVVRRILAYTNVIDSTSDEDIMTLLVEKLGQDEVESRCAEGVPAMLVSWIVDALDFETILDPVIVDAPQPTQGAPYALAVEVTRKPRYELSSYEPVRVQLPEQKVTDEEVEGYLKQIVLDHAAYVETEEDRPVRPGDRVNVSISTLRGAQPVEHLTSPSRSFDIGEGWFSPEFDENVTGMRRGETKTFEFQALGLHSKNERDTETLTCTVTVRSLAEFTPPQLTDEWVASHIEGAKSVGELREAIRARMAQERAKPDEEALLRPVAQELSRRLDAPISDALYEKVVNDLIYQISGQAEQSNLSLDDYLATQGMDREAFGAFLMERAREAILEGFALDSYADHFGLDLADADLDEVFLEMTGGRVAAASSLREQYEKGGHMYEIREKARRLKANKHAARRAVLALG